MKLPDLVKKHILAKKIQLIISRLMIWDLDEDKDFKLNKIKEKESNTDNCQQIDGDKFHKCFNQIHSFISII